MKESLKMCIRDSPLSQRWFAVGETIAHLDYLVCRGYAERKVVDGKNAYWLTMDGALCKSKLDCIWKNYRAK